MPEEPLFGDLESDLMMEVYKYWRLKTGRFSARLTEKRRKLIRARLKDGVTVEQMKAAIDSCVSSVWHMDRGYNDLTLILRDADKVEEFIERARGKAARAERSYKRNDGSAYDRAIRRA